MLIAFRTDASSAIGLGHLRRCISLAQALRETGGDSRFVMRASDIDAAAIVTADGFRVEILPHTLAAENDADAFCDLIEPDLPRWVVVDHYAIDASWHRRVRHRWNCSIAAIDDLADRQLDVDALIDHNLVPKPGHKTRYASVMTREPAAWLCGPRFALLGPAYAKAAKLTIESTVRSIGIFLGGTDPSAMTPLVVEACRTVAKFNGPIEVASTSANAGLADLQAIAAVDTALTLSVDLPDLASFHARHGLQVGAGGGATWERCCIGVPTLALCVAENQRAVVPALHELDVIRTVDSNDAASIGTAVAGLLEDREARRQLSDAGRALVDGRGATRIALSLMASDGRFLRMRKATLADAMPMWQWRNARATRQASRQADEIPFDAHLAWMNGTLGNPKRHLFVATAGSIQVGVVRFDRLDGPEDYEVSLYLDPALHGLGLGQAMLSSGESAISSLFGDVTIHAEVLPDNPASQRLFVAAGYTGWQPMHFRKRLTRTHDGRPTP